MAHYNFVISQNAKWGHAGFYIDCHRMTVPENILLQKSTADQRSAVCAVRSAGGTGVLLNIDRLSGRLSSLAAGAKLRGIADSGWFLDNRPYRRLACSDALLCSPADSVRRGIR